MIVFYGGSSSGKSKAAEDRAVLLGRSLNKKLIYMATMEAYTEAAMERIEHHRRLRMGKGFETIEEMYAPSSHENEIRGSVVLLECVSNLVANVFYRESQGAVVPRSSIEPIAHNIFSSIRELEKEDTRLVVVTNNVFSNGRYEDDWCDQYMQILARVNCLLGESASEFFEVNAGIIYKIKGD